MNSGLFSWSQLPKGDGVNGTENMGRRFCLREKDHEEGMNLKKFSSWDDDIEAVLTKGRKGKGRRICLIFTFISYFGICLIYKVFLLSLIRILWDRYYHPHFSGQETEVQSVWQPWPRSHSYQAAELGWKSKPVDSSKSCYLYFAYDTWLLYEIGSEVR